jgi:CBS domain-containing protein
MARHRIGSLPVVDEGRVVGLISERTLLPYAERLLDPDQTAPALTAGLSPPGPLVV